MVEHVAQPEWTEVERWLTRTVVKPGPEHERALETAGARGMPPIEVQPTSGKLLNLLVRISGARRVLEIGTLAGFSTIWMGQALPEGGHLDTLEYLPEHAAVARENLAAAGLAEKVTVHVGRALETLDGLSGPYDLVFIDADKQNNSRYLEWAVRLGRPGTVVVLDNAVWEGTLLHPERGDADAPSIVESLELLGGPLFDATVVQTAGSKGWDGFALAVVK
ncbi:putative O-methyltransferase YrrM [Sinomonas atrocyanea]|uniref:O-methyltransferase n=1 Tax=Sinomonas atrocyanea TaxID=37927 RepID=UPI002784CA20|nr:O-methyltransferase [Sinomonas atrocyanea]MDP9883004.1 putative O-methyltransferase YrrM [Sinomonas atrocyanea]